MNRQVATIGRALDDIFLESEREGILPTEASDARVQRILAAHRN